MSGPGALTLRPGERLALDEERGCLLVTGGEVQVFAAVPDGPRWPLGVVRTGGLLVGATGFGLEALHAAGTAELLPLPPGAMPPAAAPGLAAAAEGWVSLLAAGLGRNLGPRPVPQATLRAGQSVTLPAGATLAAGGSGCWMMLEGEASLFGLVPFTAPLPLPLPPAAWLNLDGKTRAEAMDGAAWMGDAGLADETALWLEALRRFTADCLEALPLIRGLAEADEANRLRLRAAREAAQAAETGTRLAAILGNPPPPLPGGADEALFLALSRVARAAHLPLRRPQQRRESELDRLPDAEDIARASNLRLRPVRLPENWWRQDLGPLLGWHRMGGGAPVPVALLPGRRRYRLVRDDGGAMPLTAALARQVEPQAQALLQPLPDAPPGAGVLARFGTRGSGGDTAMIFLALVLGALLGQGCRLPPDWLFPCWCRRVCWADWCSWRWRWPSWRASATGCGWRWRRRGSALRRVGAAPCKARCGTACCGCRCRCCAASTWATPPPAPPQPSPCRRRCAG
ncbi:hypothetical protein ACFQU7_30395 [Pseudoroseomonas wenyumeiae]